MTRMAKIDSAWLREQSVEGDDITLSDIAGHANRALNMLITEALIEALSDEELREFKRLPAAAKDESVRQEWLKQHCSDYAEVVERVTVDFQRNIIESEHPITYILEHQI